MRALSFVLLFMLAASPASAQDIELRPIDRATVRVVGVHGVQTAATGEREPRRRRVYADTVFGHGSGVAIAPRLVLTARHVVWGGAAWAVMLPGQNRPIAARPIFVDLELDLAFLQTAEDLPDHVELPAVRSLRMSEPVSTSGYPLDLREPNPAAVSGEVSRVTRDGLLHLAMPVNPGNSGGPVVDAQGRVIAVISQRGLPQAGVSGLAIAVPLPMILASRGRIPDRPVRFPAHAGALAEAIGLLASLDASTLPDSRARIEALLGRLEGYGQLPPEHQMIFAALGWNMVIASMLRHEDDEGQVERSVLRAVEPTYRAAVALARRALARAPHLRRSFAAVRLISIGRSAPFREAED